MRAHRAAIGVTPARDPGRAGRQSNLGIALQALAEATGDRALLEEAVRVHRSVAAGAPGGADRAGLLSNLSSAVLELAQATGDFGPIVEVVEVCRQALAAAPETGVQHAECAYNLAVALQVQARQGPAADLLAEAATLLAQAAEDTSARPLVRVGAYQQAARLAGSRRDSASALMAIEAAVGLLPAIAPGTLTRPDREYQISRLAGIAADAAAIAISAGQPDHAVELLEQTRGILLADALQARSSDLAALTAIAPALARELRDARANADSADRTSAPILTSAGAARMARRAQLGSAVPRLPQHIGMTAPQVIDRVRRTSLPGFLVPPQLDALAPADSDGPVAFVTASPVRCDVLIVRTGGSPQVDVVPLPGLSSDEVHEQCARFAAAQMTATHPAAQRADRNQAQAELLTVLTWAWDTITGPVLDALGHTTTPSTSGDWPRMWWCPVGVLAFLPLHAAGHHDDLISADTALAANPRTALDRVISSYVITLRGMAHARACQPDPGQRPALIVAIPDAPGLPPLPGAGEEASEISALIDGAQVLSGPSAACDRVLAALPNHTIAHFACHGRAGLTDPAAGQLFLTDHQASPLTVRDVVALELNASLAYLSACETGLGPAELADEAVHLTGAFHLAGYQHVIGTLWPVYDPAAQALASDVYRRLTHDGTAPPDTAHAAACLHHAVRELRKRGPLTPTHWAGHTHTGP